MTEKYNGPTFLCNQGCGTRLRFKGNIPHNALDGKKHSETCMSLKIGKWWGGHFNTIPMDILRAQLDQILKNAKIARQTRSVDDLMHLLNNTLNNLDYVMNRMDEQAKWNAEQREEFARYKARIDAQHKLGPNA